MTWRVQCLMLVLLALAASACARSSAPSAAPAAAAKATHPAAATDSAAAPGVSPPVEKVVEVSGSAPPAGLPLVPVTDKTQAISFDDVKLDLQKDEPYQPEKLTPRVKELAGQKVRIRGWILPTSVYTQRGIKQFVLVRDNQQCCFGPGAALHDCIVVDMDEGRTTSFSNRPIAVEGVFSLNPVLDPDGARTLAIYHLQAHSAGE